MLNETIDAVLPNVKKWRHYLHQHPELSFEEFETTAYLIAQIQKLPGVTIERPTPTGVAASFSCAKPGPTIALRGDIDALPVAEKTDVPFASTVKGCMHACGHDAHAALLLGALYVLYAHRDSLRGTFKFLFQPAEEKFPGGARRFIEKGVLDGVDAILGQHTDPRYKVGQIATRPGYISANSDCFDIKIIGHGGHASQPQYCLDPLPVGAQIVTALQQVVPRCVAATDPAVLSVTMFHCGTADNVIADEADISGTVRTQSQETRNMIQKYIESIVTQYTSSFGLQGNVKYRRGYHGSFNTAAYTETILDLTRKLFGEEAACIADPHMGGEDFGFYLEKVPGCFYHFGITPKEAQTFYPNHNAKFYIDESCFRTALTIMVYGAIRFQKIVEKNKK